MSIRPVAHVIAYLVGVTALAMLAGAGIAFYYGEAIAATSLLAAAGISLLSAAATWFLTRGNIDLSRRDGFGIAVFGWLFVSAFGSLPYLFSGVITSPVAAVFETMSGYTTTGASVLSNLEALPRGILFWRAMTHFFGGMGVLVLCVAILPFLKVGAMQIYRAEVPGPAKDRLTPRIAATAKLLWGAYVLFCVLQTAMLMLGGMSLFDSWCHACATMATGGFSPRTASVGAYDNAYFDIVMIFFMFLAGTNFALHLRLFSGKPFAYFRDAEFRFYLLFWLAACLLLTFNIWGQTYDSFPKSLRAAFFQGTSIMTTTGFVTEDFNRWPAGSKMLLATLMFVGGCAGSTGGGVKNIRILTGIKAVFRELLIYMRPDAVKTVRIGGAPLKDRTVSNICAFLLIFVLLFAVGTLVMTAFTPDLGTAASSTIACLGNIGPGFNAVGARGNYAGIPDAGKSVLIVLMLLGRLELYTVLVIFMPSFWRK